jgi:3-hydroxyacyl-CoA dehydrogenase
MVRAGKLGVKSKEGFYDYSENKKAEKISKQLYKVELAVAISAKSCDCRLTQ